MQKSRFTEEQIPFALKQADGGGRGHSADGDFGADILPLEEALWRAR